MITADALFSADSLFPADGLLPGVLDVVRVAQHYQSQLAALLPTGLAWPREPASTLQRLLAAWAVEFARAHAAADTLIDEANPARTQAMLADWLRVAGVPDQCVEQPLNAAESRTHLLRSIADSGTPTPAYFVALAAAFGFSVSITEFIPHSVEDDVEAPIYDLPWAHAWQVNSPLEGSVVPITVEDDAETPIESWMANTVLECLFQRLKPAHTTVIFSYS